jgi:REP element-mobilizing transposase RayT
MDFRRKDIRLAPERYIGQSSYFITFCCAHRRQLFATATTASWFVEKLRDQSNAYGFAVQAYCVMPDHFHALVTGRNPTSDLLAFATNLK